MRRMNDLLRAYGNFDVVAGNFSMYSKIKIRQGKIDGHVKPLFSDMKVYDSASGGREKHVSAALRGAGVSILSASASDHPINHEQDNRSDYRHYESCRLTLTVHP